VPQVTKKLICRLLPPFILALSIAVSLGCELEEGVTKGQPKVSGRLSVKVLAEYPHDSGAFTQGLLWYDGALYESTGNYGSSSLRKVRLETGNVIKQVSLSQRFFAEGLARVRGQLFQLTWRAGVALIYDLSRLRESGTLNYSGEGWGLSYDGTWLVMSDGSDVLTFRDPKNMVVWKRLPVTLQGNPVKLLNELECAQGAIFANVWQQTNIMRIEPDTGKVTAVVDASVLLTRMEWPPRNVMNGIAYAPERGTFFLTGKYWPKVFEVQFE